MDKDWCAGGGADGHGDGVSVTREAAALARLDDIAQAYLCRQEIERLTADGAHATPAPSLPALFRDWLLAIEAKYPEPTLVMKDGTWQTVTDAAVHYGVSRQRIYRWIWAGRVLTMRSKSERRQLVWCAEARRVRGAA